MPDTVELNRTLFSNSSLWSGLCFTGKVLKTQLEKMGCFHHADDPMCFLFLSPDNLNNEFSKGALQPVLNAGCKKPLFEVAYKNIALQLNIFLRALQNKINVEKERMMQVRNIT